MKRQQCFPIEVSACKQTKCFSPSEEKKLLFIIADIYLNKPLSTRPAVYDPGRTAGSARSSLALGCAHPWLRLKQSAPTPTPRLAPAS